VRNPVFLPFPKVGWCNKTPTKRGYKTHRFFYKLRTLDFCTRTFTRSNSVSETVKVVIHLFGIRPVWPTIVLFSKQKPSTVIGSPKPSSWGSSWSDLIVCWEIYNNKETIKNSFGFLKINYVFAYIKKSPKFLSYLICTSIVQINLKGPGAAFLIILNNFGHLKAVNWTMVNYNNYS